MPVEDEDGYVSFAPNSSEAKDDDDEEEEAEADGEDDPPCFLPSISSLTLSLSLTAFRTTVGNTLQREELRSREPRRVMAMEGGYVCVYIYTRTIATAKESAKR